MQKTTLTHLTSLHLNGLWGELDINWVLDPKINILIGSNGSGKTTLLNLIYSVISEKDFHYADFSSIELNLNASKNIKVDRITDPSKIFSEALTEGEQQNESRVETGLLQKILSSSEEMGLLQKILFSSGGVKFGGAYKFDSNIFSEKEKNNNLKFSSIIQASKISTFDLSRRDRIRVKEERNPYVKTELDALLLDLIDEFKGYQLKLRNLEKEGTAILDNEIKLLSSKEVATKEELDKLRKLLASKEESLTNIYQQKNQFTQYINELFCESKKEINFDKNNSIIFNKKEKQITPYQLSSGEKQILILFLTVVLQENNPSIILMDEPEISLHLSWQLKLIEMLQALNPNAQLIIATHSPGVFTKGWKDKVVKMEDIIQEKSHG